MALPLDPPLTPMLAKSIVDLPAGEEGDWWFEPKWDGFRCLAWRDGDSVELTSRNGRPLTRYFPELLEPVRRALPDRAVIDGEVVVAAGDALDFDLLGQRIHPAESRITRLAAETPAQIVAFDLLALDDADLTTNGFADRRRRLESALTPNDTVHLTPATVERERAADWFVRFEGAGLDGVIAKPADSAYRPGERGWLKIKHSRTADAVVAGYRAHKDGNGVGSLLLGLHDETGRLHNVGVASSFKADLRRELRTELEPLIVPAAELADHPWGGWADPEAHAGGRLPGAPSRWNATKDLSFVALRPSRVLEVGYERVDHGRFRHVARFKRWRPDRDPESCTYDQLEVVPPMELINVLHGR